MRLDLLRCLVATAETGSASGAGKVLGIGQPSATRRLQALERLVGEPLFDRARRPWRLTAAGARTLTMAQQMLRTADSITAGFQQLPDGPVSGTLNIGFGPTAGTLLGGRLARAAFTCHDPGQQVVFHHGPSSSVIQQLMRGDLDLVLTDASDLARHAGIGIGPTYSFDIQLWVRTDHPAGREGPLSLAQLFQYPMVGPNPPVGVEEVLRPVLPGRGAITDALTLVSEDIEALLAVVVESDCVLIAARPMVTRVQAAVGVRQVSLDHPLAIPARIRMAASPHRGIVPATQAWVSAAVDDTLMAFGAVREP